MWALENLKQSMKSRKDLKTLATCSYMLAQSFFTLVHMSISSVGSTLACNSNFSLVSFAYNLIVEAKAFNNNQYPQCWLTTHVVTTRESASQIALAIAQVYVEGILFAKASIWWP